MLQQSLAQAGEETIVANEKILIFEAPWSRHIDQTQATRDIYTSAETLLRVGPHPVRVIQRPLIKSHYIEDIREFTELECNQRGPNFIVFSAARCVQASRITCSQRPRPPTKPQSV